MPTQTYETHRHNPKLTGIGFFCLLVAIVGFALRWFGFDRRLTMGLGLLGLIATDLVLLLISRAYTTKLQDRIIKLEMKVRCAGLLTPAQQSILGRLSDPHVIALRFASDAELPALVESVERENLTPDQVKRAIKDWVADWHRT